MRTIESVCDELKAVLIAKNKAYGNSARRVPVLCPELGERSAILVRMSDKVARVASLRAGAPDNGEALADTILDLAGYCVLYLSTLDDGDDVPGSLAEIDAGDDL